MQHIDTEEWRVKQAAEETKSRQTKKKSTCTDLTYSIVTISRNGILESRPTPNWWFVGWISSSTACSQRHPIVSFQASVHRATHA